MTVASASIVVLIRAWREGEGVRGRLLCESGEDVEVGEVAQSVEELCRLACAALEVWDATT